VSTPSVCHIHTPSTSHTPSALTLAGSSVDHTQPLSIVTPSPGPLRFTLHRNAGLSPGQQKVSDLPPASFFF
jgi:hypothetical protein